MNALELEVLTPQEYAQIPDLIEDICSDILEPIQRLVEQHPEYIDVHMMTFNGNMLMAAACSGSLKIVRFLLRNGSNPELINQNRCTALMFAAMHKHYQTVKYLLEFGVDVNQMNTRGYTALIEAVKVDQSQIVQLLLDYGADINHCSFEKETALMIASYWRHTSCVKVLLDRGANRHIPNQRGYLPDAVCCWYLVDKSEEESLRQLILSYD